MNHVNLFLTLKSNHCYRCKNNYHDCALFLSFTKEHLTPKKLKWHNLGFRSGIQISSLLLYENFGFSLVFLLFPGDLSKLDHGFALVLATTLRKPGTSSHRFYPGARWMSQVLVSSCSFSKCRALFSRTLKGKQQRDSF